MAEAWPASLARSIITDFWPENVSRSGGASLNGMEQTVASEAMRWRARVSVAARSREQVLALRAFLGRLQGRANEALVPVCDGKFANWPVQSIVQGTTSRVLHPGVTRDPTLDGTAYESLEIPTESAVNATLNANAALRAVSLGINMTQGAPLSEGQYFGLANRLYLIHSITSVVGAVTTVTFRPPLRAAASAGAAITLTRPICTMKLISDDQAELFMNGRRRAYPTLEFVESFT